MPWVSPGGSACPSGEGAEVPRGSHPPAIAHHTQELITSVDGMLHTPGDLEDLSLSERHKVATHLLSELERVLRTLAKAMPGASFTYHSPLNTGETSPCPGPYGAPRAPSHCPPLLRAIPEDPGARG